MSTVRLCHKNIKPSYACTSKRLNLEGLMMQLWRPEDALRICVTRRGCRFEKATVMENKGLLDWVMLPIFPTKVKVEIEIVLVV